MLLSGRVAIGLTGALALDAHEVGMYTSCGSNDACSFNRTAVLLGAEMRLLMQARPVMETVLQRVMMVLHVR